MGRWEPVLAGVLALQGEVYEGEPSVGGVGAGRMVWLDSSKRTEDVRPRDILVTQYPLQNYSPLLWDAAGLITIGGAPTAHLFEVARSLTVPAVINCPIAEIVRAGPCLGMLDGAAGRVSILRG
jgi:phosphoenolpyruvate synthase/pyruvate phosphate dikinase